MSYLVLARKYRPKLFSEVSGQDHVVKALQNSLANDKVHHAFLFAGTRGVGKTTIARLLAKALNCETGVVSEPCGQCEICTAIDEGNYLDLIEVDAASQSKVEETRELLENTQYTPTVGRFKIYIIDEVHQLSKHSFNALLKTLEEPPPHVKFLLATTESHKLPITVLSRCMKFNLKKISSELIKSRMKEICEAEKDVDYEDNALMILSKAADGSMRDGLSLLDQALAFEDYSLTSNQVELMLGTIDVNNIFGLLTSIINQDPVTLNQGLKDLDDLYPDYKSLLDNMASILQQVAFLQITGNNKLNREQEMDKAVINFATEIQPEVIQLLYQITITSKRDIELAPSQREGFSMAILRMYAFTASADEQSSGTQTVKTRVKKKEAPETLMKTSIPNESELDMEQNELQLNAKNWLEEIKKLNLSGALRQLASHCSFKSLKKNTLYLTIDSDHGHLLSDQLNKKFNELLINHFKSVSNISIEQEPESGLTLAKKKSTKQKEQLIMNESRSRSDPIIEKVKDLFGATLKN